MKTKNKYIVPEMEIIDLILENVIADSDDTFGAGSQGGLTIDDSSGTKRRNFWGED